MLKKEEEWWCLVKKSALVRLLSFLTRLVIAFEHSTLVNISYCNHKPQIYSKTPLNANYGFVATVFDFTVMLKYHNAGESDHQVPVPNKAVNKADANISELLFRWMHEKAAMASEIRTSTVSRHNLKPAKYLQFISLGSLASIQKGVTN
jgi:hypothetical protein